MDHRLSNGEQISIPDHDTFYGLLTGSSAGLISEEEQTVLREAAILIVGCGAVGANAAEGLIRTGAEWLTLVDPRECDYSHLSRMAIDLRALGRNRASVMAERSRDINPYATIRAVTDAISDENAHDIVGVADVIIDALGIESPEDLRARLLLHTTAAEQRVPVISGFDVACSGWVLVYDYRDPGQAVLGGSLSEADLGGTDTIDQIEVLTRMISLSKAPIEMVHQADRILKGQSEQLPRLGFSAQLTSSIVCHTILDLLFERPVRAVISVDLASATRRPAEGLKLAGRRLMDLYSLRRQLRNRRRDGRVGVYSPLDDDVFKDLRPYMEERTYETGSVIVRQGDPAEDFFVIVSGRVQIEREEYPDPADGQDPDDISGKYTVIAELGTGDFFGEMALLTDSPRTASVVVTDRCRVLALSRGAFGLFLEESSPAAERLRDAALRRQRENRLFIGA